jgi:hypothetical protein
MHMHAAHARENHANMHEHMLTPHVGVSVAGQNWKTLFFLALARVSGRCAYLFPRPGVCSKAREMTISDFCPSPPFSVMHPKNDNTGGRVGVGKTQKKTSLLCEKRTAWAFSGCVASLMVEACRTGK